MPFYPLVIITLSHKQVWLYVYFRSKKNIPFLESIRGGNLHDLTICLQTVIWFYVYLSDTNNFQADLFDPTDRIVVCVHELLVFDRNT